MKNNYIYGKNTVKATIVNKEAIKVFMLKGSIDKSIVDLCNKNKVPLNYIDNFELTRLIGNVKAHQGVVCQVNEYSYYNFLDLIKDGKNIKNPIIIMLDEIVDPHNLGAILRICDAFNVLGLVIKDKNQVPLNATVAKASTGAINYVKVCQVNNLNNAIKTLKDNGYWIVSTDMNTNTKYTDLKYDFPTVLIIGSEGFGISKLVLKNSDYIVKIDMFGHVNSLNASNALAITLSNIIRSR